MKHEGKLEAGINPDTALECDPDGNVFLPLSKFQGKGQLSINLPANTQNGTYKISVFQNDALVSSKVTTFAENQTDLSIAQIWTTRTDYPTTLPSFFKANRVVVARGQSLFMNPLPGIMRMGFLGEAPKAFPSLLLVKPEKRTEIKAIMKCDITYGDGSFPLYFGEYQIAQHVEPGIYEARLLYANLAESMPFWSKIEIK